MVRSPHVNDTHLLAKNQVEMSQVADFLIHAFGPYVPVVLEKGINDFSIQYSH